MACLLEFIQGERVNRVGIFRTEENAVAFLESIPFIKKRTGKYGVRYTIRFDKLPESHCVSYNGWRYVLSKYSYSAHSSDGHIEAVLIKLCELDLEPEVSNQYVQSETTLDAYSYANAELPEMIEKREIFYHQALEYYKKQGRKIGRDGLGSQDGEYVTVSKPNAPEEHFIAFLLDPQTIRSWEAAGNFEGWIAINPTVRMK